MRILRAYLPVAVAVTLLVLVLRRVGVGELVMVARNADLRLVVLAFVISSLTFLPKILNWQQLLRAQGHRVPFTALVRLYLVGIFFNNLLPTNVGGDVVRSYEVGRRIGDPATAFASVFVERFIGLVVLVVFATVSFLTHFGALNNPVLALAMLVAGGALLALGWLALDPTFSVFLERWLPPSLQRYLVKARKVQSALHRYRGQPRLLASSLFFSVLFNAGAVLYAFVAISAFHDPVDFVGTIFIVPITMVVAMMPISFNGVGLQEWAAVLLFPTIAIPASAALSGMLLIRALTLIKSLIGGLFYLQLKAQHALRGTDADTLSASQ